MPSSLGRVDSRRVRRPGLGRGGLLAPTPGLMDARVALEHVPPREALDATRRRARVGLLARVGERVPRPVLQTGEGAPAVLAFVRPAGKHQTGQQSENGMEIGSRLKRERDEVSGPARRWGSTRGWPLTFASHRPGQTRQRYHSQRSFEADVWPKTPRSGYVRGVSR